jgi:hypothetical protein
MNLNSSVRRSGNPARHRAVENAPSPDEALCKNKKTINHRDAEIQRYRGTFEPKNICSSYETPKKPLTTETQRHRGTEKNMRTNCF